LEKELSTQFSEIREKEKEKGRFFRSVIVDKF